MTWLLLALCLLALLFIWALCRAGARADAVSARTFEGVVGTQQCEHIAGAVGLSSGPGNER
jgi:hypothetical protein